MYKKYAILRDARGLNDNKVCKATGIASATISSWKNGRYTPKIDKLQKIAELLGVSVTDII